MLIYSKLKELRAFLKLTQKDIQDATGLSQRDISQLENGEKKFIPTSYIQFLNKKNIPLNLLYDEDVSVTDFISHVSDPESMEKDTSKHILTTKPKEKEETRPRIPMDAAAGSLTVAADGITINDCEQIPIIRAFARYDFSIFARGDSMLPEYHSGDELACVYIKDTSFIQWGRIHVVDTAQGILVKRIFDGGDCIVCKSDNPDYPEFKVHKSEFYNVALVIGMLRRY